MVLTTNYNTPGKWKDMTFDPVALGETILDDTLTKVVLVFDSKNASAGKVWYFEDLVGPVVNEAGPVFTYADFDNITPAPVKSAGAVYGGVKENPYPSGINLSDSVGQFYTGSITYASIYWDLPSTIDFSNGSEFKMMVYSADSIGRARLQLEKAGNTSTQCKIFAEYTTAGEWQELTFNALDGGQLPLRNHYYNRMVIVFDNTASEVGEEWYYDNIVGPKPTSTYMVKALFTVTSVNTGIADFKIDLNNSGTKIQLYDDGSNGDMTAADNVWSVELDSLPVGSHVIDVYGDDAIVDGGDDVAFELPEQFFTPVSVAFSLSRVDALFKVISVNTGVTDFKIDINNSGTKTQMYDDGTHGDEVSGDNIWSVQVNQLPVGTHALDIYGDNVIVPNGDDVAFVIPETMDPVTIEFTYSTISVNENEIPGIYLYPNPTSADLSINSLENIQSVAVYNLLGKEIFRRDQIRNNEFIVPSAAFESGYYIIRITSEKGITKNAQFLRK
jgi:hypothetical protein